MRTARPGRTVVNLDTWARMLAEGPAEGAERSRHICQLCAQLLAVTGAGISMVTVTGNRGIVCATDEVSARIEDLQFTLGEGACVEAVKGGVPVMVNDLHEPGDVAVERWPAFMEGIAAAGVRAVFALPLRIGGVSVGALDLYRDLPGKLTTGQLSAALTAANAAAVALLHLGTGYGDLFADDTDGRATYQMQVHQASGMVQIQAGVTIDEAFLMLRAHAFAAVPPAPWRDLLDRLAAACVRLLLVSRRPGCCSTTRVISPSSRPRARKPGCLRSSSCRTTRGRVWSASAPARLWSAPTSTPTAAAGRCSRRSPSRPDSGPSWRCPCGCASRRSAG